MIERWKFFKKCGIDLKTEADIQSEIMIELSKRGHKIFRANAGKIKTEFGTYIKLFPKGFPDLCGWRKSDGKFIAIEVKNEKGKLRPEQVKFSEFAKSQPILYGVARSADEAIKIVEGESDESKTEKKATSK